MENMDYPMAPRALDLIKPTSLRYQYQALAALIALLLLTSCGSLDRPTPALPAAKGTAYGQATPVAVVHLLCTSPDQLPTLLSAADDPAIAFRGTHRVADGTLSIGIKDSHKHWLRGVECGGRMILPGTLGEPCSLEVVNESDRAIDIEISHDGTPLTAGKLQLEPHATKGVPLTWSMVSGAASLYRYDPASQQGVISITAFQAAGQPSRLTQRLVAPPTGGPQRKFAPIARPFEYR
jgi:hypothetical protein